MKSPFSMQQDPSSTIVSNNRANIEKILKVLSRKPLNQSNKESTEIIKRYFEWLLTPESGINDISKAVCIHNFLNYPATKPGKIYVWPDNLVNLHMFIVGKTNKFAYKYPDTNNPAKKMWTIEVSYNTHKNSVKYSETWGYNYLPNTWYNAKELAQLLKI